MYRHTIIKGDRFLSVMHARMRNNCSNLNSDLCNNHLRDDPYCDCVEVVEDAEHYLFQCPKFQRQRIILLQSLQRFLPFTTSELLKGKTELSYLDNCAIFSAIQLYIKSTKRLLKLTIHVHIVDFTHALSAYQGSNIFVTLLSFCIQLLM